MKDKCIAYSKANYYEYSHLMTRVLQNFNANLKRLKMVLANPGASQTCGLASDFKAWLCYVRQ